MSLLSPLISVVDDDSSILRALRRLIQAAGYTVATFASAPEFLASPMVDGTACLILDIYLQGMSGFDLQERLAVHRPALPIIFITAHDDLTTRERIRQSGVATHLRKPFDERLLLDAIRTALAPA